MFEIKKENFGWARIVFPDYSSRISYVTDVVYHMLAFIKNLQNNAAAAPVLFYAEGYYLYLFWDGMSNEAILLSDEGENGWVAHTKSYSSRNEFLREIIEDFYCVLSYWTEFTILEDEQITVQATFKKYLEKELITYAKNIDKVWAQTLIEGKTNGTN